MLHPNSFSYQDTLTKVVQKNQYFGRGYFPKIFLLCLNHMNNQINKAALLDKIDVKNQKIPYPK